MFAISGWSVSADKLRPETASVSVPQSASETQQQPSKKRKRKQNNPDVNSNNVADLWEKVVEGKGPAPKPAAANGQAKKDDSAAIGKRKRDGDEDEVMANAADENSREAGQKKKKRNRRNKRDVEKNGNEADKDKNDNEAATTAKSKVTSSKKAENTGSNPPSRPSTMAEMLPPATQLTPLQQKMREKLISARFRHLNEALYTRPSVEAFEMFQESPEMFVEYHEGFRRQVQVWPENPVDGYIASIRDRARRKPLPAASRSGAPIPAASCPLPRNSNNGGVCTIADLGCGDARLAESLLPDSKRLRVRVLSFDLQSPSPHVTRADIANLPLADGSVDVAIFCLALMGTNWVKFIEEAYRVLRWKGELWVAEIKSRFARPAGGSGVVEHSVGKRRNPIINTKPNTITASAKRKATEAAEAADELDLAVEVDGAADSRRETDVKSFVDVLYKRGFVLHPDSGTALDLSNKMFVKIHFVKSATPTRGKGMPKPKDDDNVVPSRKSVLKGVVDSDDEAEAQDGAVLKPCVYKLR